jgi:asparagine synthetase B (glutamine-hydrolysing)
MTINQLDNTINIDTIPYLKSSIDIPSLEPLVILLTEFESNPIFQNISNDFLHQLQTAVQRRVINLPSLCRQCKRLTADTLRPTNGCEHAKLAVLFSGGIDSTVLAALADRILPINEPIDLLNVAFFSDVSTPPADRQTGLQALTELNSSRQWNFIKVKTTIRFI